MLAAIVKALFWAFLQKMQRTQLVTLSRKITVCVKYNIQK